MVSAEPYLWTPWHLRYCSVSSYRTASQCQALCQLCSVDVVVLPQCIYMIEISIFHQSQCACHAACDMSEANFISSFWELHLIFLGIRGGCLLSRACPPLMRHRKWNLSWDMSDIVWELRYDTRYLLSPHKVSEVALTLEIPVTTRKCMLQDVNVVCILCSLVCCLQFKTTSRVVESAIPLGEGVEVLTSGPCYVNYLPAQRPET